MIASRTYAQPQPKLMLSFVPVEFEGAKDVTAGSLNFDGPDKLEQLRKKHELTHVLHRSGAQILSIPLSQDAEQIGEPCIANLGDFRIAERVVRETLIRHFKNQSYLLTRLKPIALVDLSDNLLAKSCASLEHRQRIAGLAIYPKYELDTRTIFPRDQDPVPGVAIDLSTTYQIELSLDKLVSRGVDIVGRYAVVADGFKGKLLGKIESTAGGKAKLSDCAENAECDLSRCRLESSKENFLYCLRQFLGDAYPVVQTRLDSTLFNLLGGPGMLSNIGKIRTHIAESGPFNCAAGARFKVGGFYLPGTDGAIPSRSLRRPDFIFDPTGAKTKTWHDFGLNDFGPFDSEFFTCKEPRIVVITPEDAQGEAELFAKQLRDGIANSKGFQKGFVRKYHLNGCKIVVQSFKRGENLARAYREACIKALQDRYDLALVVIEERFHELHGDANPYLVSKAVFMGQGVPVQEVEIETIRSTPYQIQYILNNMALACYCKLGGIPYAITSSPVVAQELVIGLGSAIIRKQRLQGSDRVVGITTIFSADGTYLLSNASKEADYEGYVDELLSSLRCCIEDVKKRNAWQDGDQVRLVFHVFKPLQDLEAIAIKRFVEEIAGKYQIEFAFLTFTRDHPFTMFDQNQAGVGEWGPKKGALVPERGFAINTSGNQALLTVTGPRQLKTALQGCPKPIILKLHRESTFRDLGYLTHQAYRFTFLSWRSFFPTTSPVTIAYSQLIARMLGELKGVSNWNPETLRTRLRTSGWFL